MVYLNTVQKNHSNGRFCVGTINQKTYLKNLGGA